MPTPIIVTANVTLRIFRWPTLPVAQAKAQAMPIMSTPLAIRACRMPPKPATMTTATATSDRPLAQIIDCLLDRISSSSITGSPVRPISASAWRSDTRAICCRRVSVAFDAPAKPPSSLVSRSNTKPRVPSFASRYWLDRSRRVERLPGIPGQGET